MRHPTLRTLADIQATIPWKQPYDRSLEEYLRALWMLVQAHRDEHVSWALICFLLTEAFTTEPLAFDPQWLQYDAPPLREDIPDPYAYLHQMLLYQIADLHRMQEAGTLNFSPVILYGGVDSPTGHRWYNFSTESYFECAFSGAEGLCCIIIAISGSARSSGTTSVSFVQSAPTSASALLYVDNLETVSPHDGGRISLPRWFRAHQEDSP